MVTQKAGPATTSPEGTATAPASAPAAESKVRIVRISLAGTATLWGAVVGALALVWVLYERVLPFSGVLGFWLCWYLVFVLLYAAMARMQWDRGDVGNQVTAVGL